MTLTSQTQPTGTGTAAAAPTRHTNSFWQSVGLVAGREIGTKLRDKAFLFSTVFFLLLTVASTVLPAMLSGGPSSVAVVGSEAAEVLDRAGLEVRTVADEQAARDLVLSEDVDSAVVVGPNGVRVLALDEAPSDVVGALSTAPPVELLAPNAVDPVVRLLVPLVFGMVFFFTSITFGIQIAQSVTEEKQTRIVEILVATVPVRALLAGKVIAASALAIGQIVLIAIAAVVGMTVTDSGAIMDQLAPAIGWFIPFFLVGFVLLAAIWAVTGALVSRQEDIGSVSMPVQLLVLVPFFAVIFGSDNNSLMTVLSYVPFSAPTAMPVRLFLGEAAGWEPVLALLLLLGAAVAVLLFAARLYEGSLLRTNGRTTLAAAWRNRGN
ncbi:ABC transporter permease [Micromonospora sp. NBC_01699]|uniref:ABC transporter permease n=1 Tax=Micromonospora sp. NBC_01699 TaxID=2975984 RepID=UPI002E35E241|nr:ABC transporter permease [Micromonospora sp. NBC_01699]